MKRFFPTTWRAVVRSVLLGVGCLLAASCYDNNDYNVVFTPYWRDAGVVVADFNSDGLPDVAVAQAYVTGPPPHQGYIAIYLQNAGGTFASPVRYRIGPDPWALASGDLDGTGHVDLVATIPSSAPGVPDSGQISILHHDPNRAGAFLAAQTIGTGGGGDSVAIGDVNGDGHADIVVADSSVSDAHAILFTQSATSPGTFLAPVSLSLGTNRGSNDVAIHDMNGDGLNDIVLATTDGVAILYQSSTGGFLAPVLLTVGINPQGIGVADLDGDGRPDIVVANAGYSPFGGVGGASVAILLQTVAGSFAASNITVPDGAVQVAIADLNHDGVPDIAVLSIESGPVDIESQVSVLLQSSTSLGSFSRTATYATTEDADFLAAGDLNGDGYTDLAVNNPISRMAQQPALPGTFAAPLGL